MAVGRFQGARVAAAQRKAMRGESKFIKTFGDEAVTAAHISIFCGTLLARDCASILSPLSSGPAGITKMQVQVQVQFCEEGG